MVTLIWVELMIVAPASAVPFQSTVEPTPKLLPRMVTGVSVLPTCTPGGDREPIEGVVIGKGGNLKTPTGISVSTGSLLMTPVIVADG